jgi:hypothetical protein
MIRRMLQAFDEFWHCSRCGSWHTYHASRCTNPNARKETP